MTSFSLNHTTLLLYSTCLTSHFVMKISFAKYSLELKHQFTISYSSRKSTPIVLIKIEHDGFVGYGEASLPPYLTETQESVINLLKLMSLKPSNFFI